MQAWSADTIDSLCVKVFRMCAVKNIYRSPTTASERVHTASTELLQLPTANAEWTDVCISVSELRATDRRLPKNVV